MKPQMQSSLLLPALTKPEKTSIFTVVVVHGLQKNMFAQITSDQGHETGNCESRTAMRELTNKIVNFAASVTGHLWQYLANGRLPSV